MSGEMNVREKQQVAVGQAENTTTRPLFSPVVDIWETETGLMLLADMPGVAPGNVSVDLQDSTLTITGRVEQPCECETLKSLISEYEVGDFYRQFSLSDSIDQTKIAAILKDGVLRLELPRVAPTQPRKIEVKID